MDQSIVSRRKTAKPRSPVVEALLAEVAALDVYVKAKAQLERAIGATLTVHNVSIEEAFKGQVSRASTLPATLPPPPPSVGVPAIPRQ